MKNHFGQTENQIGIGRHQEAEIKALNHMQNLQYTTDAMNPAMITRILTSVNHDHDQEIAQVLIIDQEKHQVIVKKDYNNQSNKDYYRKRSNSPSQMS